MISQVKKILLILSFIVYFLILIVFIKKKLKYIFKIQKEVERLSKVSLEYPITIYGNDEIEDIAKGIEDMRLFAIEKIEKEKQIYKSNQELLTSLTHDIRTPLTSLIGYLEILNNIKNSEKERVTYQHAALEKAYYIKKLTDSLFDYYYIQYHEKNIKMEIVNGNELIMQMVEENLFDFEIIGIKVCREIEDINCNLKLNVDLIYRVFENIFSNIKKYADLTKNLFIGYKKQDKYLLVYFKNFKKNTINSKGTHIGIKSCSNILRIHNGKLEIKEDKVSYLISIFLPILN